MFISGSKAMDNWIRFNCTSLVSEITDGFFPLVQKSFSEPYNKSKILVISSGEETFGSLIINFHFSNQYVQVILSTLGKKIA